VLEAAGVKRAKIVAVCTHKKEITDKIVDMIQSDFPTPRSMLAPMTGPYPVELRARGMDYEARETFESGMLFGRKTLEALGTPEDRAGHQPRRCETATRSGCNPGRSRGSIAGRQKCIRGRSRRSR
jgi:CPA2 family monovalent cation:H+ antiporter-2